MGAIHNNHHSLMKLCKITCAAGLCLGASVLSAFGALDEREESVIVIKNVSIHGLGESGSSIEQGMIVIRDGRIVGVGEKLSVPGGATVIDGSGGSITPGLIDAAALVEPRDRISIEARQKRLRSPEGEPEFTDTEAFAFSTWLSDQAREEASQHDHEEELLNPWEVGAAHDHVMGGEEGEEVCGICSGLGTDMPATVSGLNVRASIVEGSSEVVPHTRMTDSLNLDSPDFERLARGGVTTVFVSPDSAAVIGPRGAVVRTAGARANRILVEEGDVLASMGSDTFSVGSRNSTPSRRWGVSARTRRPNSRMGVAKVFRKAFYDAEKGLAGVEVTGGDAPPAESYEILDSIAKGDTGLRIRARMATDIQSAVRLAEEFDLSFTLVEATEAYRCYDVIQAAGLPVIFGPIYVEPTGMRSWSDETQDSRLSTVRGLFASGIDTAITAADLREEDGLARQVMYAMRAGVSFDDALDAVTRTPARMLGIDNEVGTLEAGKRGDLVLWNGAPFAATSRPVMVVMDGSVVYDGRDE